MIPGRNRVQFFPTDDHDPGSYRVRNLRIITTATPGARSTPASVRAWAALRRRRRDQRMEGQERSGADREWQFVSATKPWTLDLRLPEKSSGTLTVASVGAKGRVTVRLDQLPAGWYRVSLGQLPPSGNRLTLSLAGGGESRRDIRGGDRGEPVAG